MITRRHTLFLASFLLVAPLALATSNYIFKKDEYVTIKKGRSPDSVYSIAAHGEGQMGEENFHIYLMDGKTGKKIGPLSEITETSWQDTAPTAYHALWSADSKTVTISYRSDRSVISAVTYKIEKRRATKLKGPWKTSDKEASAFGWPDPNA